MFPCKNIDPNVVASGDAFHIFRDVQRQVVDSRAMTEMRQAAVRADAAIDRIESGVRPTYGALELMRRIRGSSSEALAALYVLSDAEAQQALADAPVFSARFAQANRNAAMVFADDASQQATA